MENSPFDPVSGESGDSKESKASSKKSKSAEAIGAIVIEPKNEKTADKPVSIIDQLIGVNEKEASETEAPLETLSETERQAVETDLVATAREAEPAETSDDSEAAAAEAAVASFREKIVDQGEDSETAFAETIAELTTEPAKGKPAVRPAEAAPTPFEEDIINLRSEATTTEPVMLGNRPLAPEAAPAEEPETTESTPSDSGRYFVAGGAVSYLAGRRRGRIKTEKRLAAVQQKLEKQVAGLKTELQRKETVIRKTAVEQVRIQTSEGPTKAPRAERTKAMPLERMSRAVGAEAITLASREAPRAESREQAEVKRTSPVQGLTEKDIITLNRQELLAVSEKIIVEGTSLRQIYETHLVGEKGLRRLVVEFLRGGNMNKALKRELVEKEIDFERDPLLRDRSGGGASSDGGGTHLDKLLEKVDSLPGGASGEMAVLKARAAHEAAQQQKRRRQRKTADISLAGIIAILLAAIIILLIGR